MNEHISFDPRRVDFCYGVLANEQVVEMPGEPSDDDKATLIEGVVLDMVSAAEMARADESERRSRVKTAMGYRAYLLPFVENASIEELRQVMGERGWSTGQKIETVASKGIKFYAKMLRLPIESEHELSVEAAEGRERLHLVPKSAIELQDGPVMDLDDTVRRLYEQKRMHPYYAQGLLVAFGKAAPSSNVEAVANTIELALEDVVRRYHFHIGDDDSVLRRFSQSYLYALGENREAPVFERLSDFAYKSITDALHDDDESRTLVESTMAAQLEVVYPVPKTK